jgi:hypothetical protein
MTDYTSNSQLFTLTAATAQAATWADWYNEIVVQVSGTGSVFVNTDGSVATTGEAGEMEVQAGSSASFANEQVKGYPFKVGAGGDPANIGGTVQSNTPASGHGTSVSLISAGTPTVLVSAQ